jgi:hypothetical protein
MPLTMPSSRPCSARVLRSPSSPQPDSGVVISWAYVALTVVM